MKSILVCSIEYGDSQQICDMPPSLLPLSRDGIYDCAKAIYWARYVKPLAVTLSVIKGGKIQLAVTYRPSSGDVSNA